MSARWRHDDETGEVPPEHAPEPAAGLAAKGEPPLAALIREHGRYLYSTTERAADWSTTGWTQRIGRQ